MQGRIIGLGSYLPEKILNNYDLEKMVETNDSWIRERTGIFERHISDPMKETTAFMACRAANDAISDADIDAKDIDLIVVATTTPNTMFPTIACQVQREIGASKAMCFDVNSACPGFLAAYITCQNFIAAGNSKLALVIGAECLSNIVDWKDRGTCILFGDAAGAAVLKAVPDMKSSYVMHSAGDRGDCLHCESLKQRRNDEGFEESTYMRMAGQEVFKFAVTEVPAVINELSEKEGIDLDSIDYFALHQANKRIIDSVSKRLRIPLEKFPLTIEQTGNTSSASIPVLLTKMKKEGLIGNGDKKVIISSFGAGLTWGAAYFEV